MPRPTGLPHALRPVLVVVLLLLLVPTAGAGSLRLASEDGESHVRLGLMAQMRAERLDPEGAPAARDLYFRRLRLIATGQLGPDWSFFLETDSPGLGHSEAGGGKNAGDMYMQDFVVSWNAAEDLTLDLGLILVPTSRNANQSAAALMTLDYGVFSFLTSQPLEARVGRDYGALLRAFPGAGDRWEIRAGLFQGRRGVDPDADPRAVVRLGWNREGAEKGLFYRGTTRGRSPRLSFGLTGDIQESYRGASADLIWDQPFGDGHGFTGQVDVGWLDGRDLAPGLEQQRILHAEAGVYLGGTRLMPFAAWSRRDRQGAAVDQDRYQAGLAWYLDGRARVLKAAWSRIDPQEGLQQDLFTLQLQIFHL